MFLESLADLTLCVKEFRKNLETLACDTSDPSACSKEAEAQLLFIVPDTGPYKEDEVKLIRDACHIWKVSRSYNSDSDAVQKTVFFKIYFSYKIANDVDEKFPGLEKFTGTLKTFLQKFKVVVRNGSEENLSQISTEGRNTTSGESLTATTEYVMKYSQRPKRKTLDEVRN